MPTSPPTRHTRLVVLTAGAGGMYCGSCLHDNALVTALQQAGVDAMLVPLYTPIRSDEADVSIDRVFFGGLNVYLQQLFPLSRFVPRQLFGWLDHPQLIRWVTSRKMSTDARHLGPLTISMLQGDQGRQRMEVDKLCHWLEKSVQPTMIDFSNILIAGSAPAIKRKLKIPIVVTLQGDDVFMDELPPGDRQRAIQEIQRIAESVDGFLTHSNFYADHMAEYLGLPRDRFRIVPLGIQTSEFATLTDASAKKTAHEPLTVGYLARLTPEKGLHDLCDAIIALRQRPGLHDVRLHVAGWSGGRHIAYASACLERVKAACGAESVQYFGAVDRQQKIRFLHSIDVLSVPCPYREPKGLYVLEALAAGVPFVQPNHGAFPELLAQTGGGRLFTPNALDSLIDQLEELLTHSELRASLARDGYQRVRQHHDVSVTAPATLAAYESLIESQHD